MEVKVRKIKENAKLPSKAHVTDAGFDLVATSKEYDQDGNIVYGTGLAFEIPEGYVGLLFPRSSNAKKDLLLSNSVGVIDSGYRGEVSFKFKKNLKLHIEYGTMGFDNEIELVKHGYEEYDTGDRIGQIIIIPYPEVEFVESETLSNSDRGEGGYGSTGK